MNLNKKELEKIAKEFTTLRDLLRWALTQFYQANLHFGHGTDNAWDEALYLVLSALHLPPDTRPEILDAKLLLSERQTIFNLIEKRIHDRWPVAYLTNEAWFAGLPFYVDERVIIPRSPLAELIEKQFQPWVKPDRIERILDLCTGSGCLAIACAENFNNTQIDAVDISSQALEVAKINVERYQLQSQIRLIRSNLFAAIPGQIYDLIISNPPYVSISEYTSLPREYHHEPKTALTAGEQGLDIVIEILSNANKHLSPEGILIVEVGNSEQALMQRFPQVPFSWLEFERGGGGVFLLTAEQLMTYQEVFSKES